MVTTIVCRYLITKLKIKSYKFPIELVYHTKLIKKYKLKNYQDQNNAFNLDKKSK